MTLAWIVGASVAVILLVALWLRSRSQKDPDLGVVSHQWLAEQRNGRVDSQR